MPVSTRTDATNARAYIRASTCPRRITRVPQSITPQKWKPQTVSRYSREQQRQRSPSKISTHLDARNMRDVRWVHEDARADFFNVLGELAVLLLLLLAAASRRRRRRRRPRLRHRDLARQAGEEMKCGPRIHNIERGNIRQGQKERVVFNARSSCCG